MKFGQQQDQSRRKHPRHPVQEAIDVIDRRTGESVGVIANISLEGVMIMGSQALEIDSIYQLTLKFGRAVNNLNSLNLGVDCMWNNTSPQNAGMQWSGCQIIDLSEADIRVLQQVIDEFTTSQG